MRHMRDGRQFGRNTSHRKAMFKAMANNLIRHEQIQTTVTKAKELRRVVDRLITLSKKDCLNSRRLAFDRTRDRSTVTKLFNTLADRYSKRNGGYTRVLRLDGSRWGDGAEIAIIELVDRPIVEKKKKGAAKAEGKTDAKATDAKKASAKAPKTAKKAAPQQKTMAKKSAVSGKAARSTPSKKGG